MRKAVEAVELSVAVTFVVAPFDAAELRTGKFCRLFAPVSMSPTSFGVTPAGARSMPRPLLARMLLP